MDNNPLINFTVLPNFSHITAGQVAPAIDTIIAGANATIEVVANNQTEPTWDNVCAPLEHVGEGVMRVWNQIEHMHAVMSTDSWRKAHQENLPKIAAYFAALGQHEGLYQRLQALSQSSAFAHFSTARKKIITNGLRDFELSGVALPADKKCTFRQNSERLSVLSASFEENALAATNDFSLTVETADELGDMPADLRAIAQQLAAANQEDGYRFTLQAPSYIAFMQYVTSSALREKMYRAYNTRASEFGPGERDNSPIIAEILDKRQQQAELLGLSNYADMALQTRMAPDSATVLTFLHNLTSRAKPCAEVEVDQLRQFAADELGLATLRASDVSYVSEHLRRRHFDFSEADLRPYLQEDKIIDGLFACVERLFGVTARLASAPVWHDDVRYREIIAADGHVIGGFYMDLYARQTKRNGAWMADVLSRYRRQTNQLQLPVAHIVCNFAKPVTGPALLNWQEVLTLFHECGHALHHLLTEVEDYSVSGISGVEWDAVELPSQLLENFVWEWVVLAPMTAHVDSQQPMPRALFDKVVKARHFQSGMRLMRQLEFALFDLSLHRGSGQSVETVLAETRHHTSVLPLPKYNRFACGFSHIFAGGYAAGYYGYLWAETLSADIFSLFKATDDIIDASLGALFRQQILAVGGSRPAMESFVAVRGRQPDIEALLAHYNLGSSDYTSAFHRN